MELGAAYEEDKKKNKNIKWSEFQKDFHRKRKLDEPGTSGVKKRVKPQNRIWKVM